MIHMCIVPADLKFHQGAKPPQITTSRVHGIQLVFIRWICYAMDGQKRRVEKQHQHGTAILAVHEDHKDVVAICKLLEQGANEVVQFVEVHKRAPMVMRSAKTFYHHLSVRNHWRHLQTMRITPTITFIVAAAIGKDSNLVQVLPTNFLRCVQHAQKHTRTVVQLWLDE